MPKCFIIGKVQQSAHDVTCNSLKREGLVRSSIQVLKTGTDPRLSYCDVETISGYEGSMEKEITNVRSVPEKVLPFMESLPEVVPYVESLHKEVPSVRTLQEVITYVQSLPKVVYFAAKRTKGDIRSSHLYKAITFNTVEINLGKRFEKFNYL